MPSTTPPPAAPASTLRAKFYRRPLWVDRLVIITLGAAGAVLSFNALRQVALAIHTTPALSFLFPVVIDGFIAYGVRAILVLRDAPLGTRVYAWTLFCTATAASLWANSLHSVRLNQPGTHTLILGDHAVAILSTIAPLALGGATHLHIVVTRHATRQQQADTRTATAGTPTMIPADTPVIPAARPAIPHADPRPAPPNAPAGPAAGTHSPDPAADIRQPPATDDTGRSGEDASGERADTPRGGRRADAPIDQLAGIIAQAHPGSGRITRAMARQAIEARGLSAGNDRITQALNHLRPHDGAQRRPHTG
ncbi:DUF2637 domain-containing protein [Streptomyces sp. B1866]|uniref:DUF2637 domain-containing protein n=1 Tax=Streptomyces sp. B1866 TaxID=3075431 RepID=UPI002891AF49|nr:DUF2637 domain-containing protein [Streptomyces sp. B1866]MDT3397630.1 DUF2637 domain-containing protein [Streptomyces sp. B1866]